MDACLHCARGRRHRAALSGPLPDSRCGARLRLPVALALVVFWALCGVVYGAPVRLEVEGVEGELYDNVLAMLTLSTQAEKGDLEAFRVRRYFNQGKAEIRTALQPFGYYNPVIHAQLNRDEEGWLAHYRIEPGPPIRIRQLDLQLTGEGAEDPQLQALRDSPGFGTGDILEHGDYRKFKKDWQTLAYQQGFLDAVYQSHELRIDAQANQADVILHLNTGQRYYFGEVSFEEVGLTRELLRRYVRFQPGDVYSPRKLVDLQRALMNSDYFEYVNVDGNREAAVNQRVPISVELRARRKHKYTVGIGFGTDTGLRGRLGWEHRRINKRGHRMEAGIRGSEIYRDLSMTYSLPIQDPRTDRLSFTASRSHENTETAESDSRSITSTLTQLREGWRETLYLKYLEEDFEVGAQTGRTTLLMPGVSWSRTRSRSGEVLVTERGMRFDLELRGAVEAILSDTSFLQTIVSTKWIHPLGARGRLISRGRIGTTWMDEFADLPPTVRFFAGGDNSVRGYEYESLGPTDSSGEVVGGRHLLIGSLEYEHRITGPWRAAVFVDAGNAFDGFSDNLEAGAGLGVRWVSPIGLVRVDVAVAVSEPDHPLRLHINLGPDL